jgi:chlorite dismutase
VHAPRALVVGVEWGEDAGLVAGGGELAGERIYVAGHAAGIAPGVRRQERDPHGAILSSRAPATRCDNRIVSSRHFVKYTFLKVDPAWRRLDAATRARHKQEFLAACEDFADGHMLQSFSLVGTRGDAELLLVAEAENLDRIHEFHVVLIQSGLMQWSAIPYSFLGMRKSSEYSEDERTVPRGFRGRYVFVYPFVKSREWYALPAEERWRIMQGHIQVGREYPGVDNHTTYSFGLDDQEFVVAFDTDDVGTFLDLVQRLRTTEASRYTVRDTPSFTCLAMSLPRALNALDGEPVALETALPAG